MRRQPLVVLIKFFVFGRSALRVNTVCSVSFVEVLLSVVLVTLVHISVIPPTFLREEVRVLLNMEALIVLMSVEASVVASQLCIVLNPIVKTAETTLFVLVSSVTCVVALVLLHR